MYDVDYFKKYQEKNISGCEKGDKWYLYHFWLRRIKQLLPPVAEVLEVGCGLGYFLSYLKKEFTATGCDISEVAVREASQRTGVKVDIASAEELPYEGTGRFDGIVAFDVIEHLAAPERFIGEAYRLLKESGVLIISTPNPNSFGARKKGVLGSYERQSNLVWYALTDSTHVSIKRRAEWLALFEDKFEVVKSGTDTLWDVPYFKSIPLIIQKIIFLVPHRILSMSFGFFPWEYGENSIFILRKRC
jgi:SAM-dependent methyltransferase